MDSQLATDQVLEVPFCYRPLSTTGRMIRVLILYPGAPDDLIECRLKHVSLDDEPSYEALSYTWGDDRLPRQSIRIDLGKIGILPNLYDALRHFRKRSERRILWVDAICINQSDFREKNVQVPLMRDIYEQASGVLVWLGEKSENSMLAVDLIQTTSRVLQTASDKSMLPSGTIDPFSDHEQVVRRIADKLPGSRSPEWNAVRELIKRPWFSRVWIIQELALASRAEVHCGPSVFGWDELARAIQFAVTVGFIEAARDSGSASIPSLNVVRTYIQEGTRKPLLSLLLQYPSFQATNPRDKIYALLGLSTTTIIPQYELSYSEVFRNAAFEMIRSECNLDIFSFPPEGPPRQGGDVFPPRETLPSWVPDFAHRTQRIQQLTLQDFETPLYTTPKFHAAGSHTNFLPMLSGDRNRLRLEGHFIDEVEEAGISQPPHRTPTSFADQMNLICTTHRVLLSWERTARLHQRNTYRIGDVNELMIDAYWQTLQGGYAPRGKAFHRDVYLKFNRSWAFHRWLHENNIPCVNAMLAYLFVLLARESSRVLYFHPGRLLDWFESQPVGNDERQFYSFCKAVVNRRLLRSKKGYIGLAPRGVRKGDRIAIVKGSKIPLIFRPAGGHGIDAGTKESFVKKRERKEWALVGDTYVHGVMFGEVFDHNKCQPLWII